MPGLRGLEGAQGIGTQGEKVKHKFNCIHLIRCSSCDVCCNNLQGDQGQRGIRGLHGPPGIPGPSGPKARNNIFSSNETGFSLTPCKKISTFLSNWPAFAMQGERGIPGQQGVPGQPGRSIPGPKVDQRKPHLQTVMREIFSWKTAAKKSD